MEAFEILFSLKIFPYLFDQLAEGGARGLASSFFLSLIGLPLFLASFFMARKLSISAKKLEIELEQIRETKNCPKKKLTKKVIKHE